MMAVGTQQQLYWLCDLGAGIALAFCVGENTSRSVACTEVSASFAPCNSFLLRYLQLSRFWGTSCEPVLGSTA
ncbi:hypothetical protein C8R45DRAFT_1036099, partial [Mycena sanguinolenta]